NPPCPPFSKGGSWSARYSIACARNFIAAGFRLVAADTRIHVLGSCVGENRLPGAHRMPCSAPAAAIALVSRPKSPQRKMPASGCAKSFTPIFSSARAVRSRAASSLPRRRSRWRRYCPSARMRATTRSVSSGVVSPVSIFSSAIGWAMSGCAATKPTRRLAASVFEKPPM
ncbi:MAG: hypothetical protein AMXMBFR72_13250, partial [Betaproteobacteria bacterium]